MHAGVFNQVSPLNVQAPPLLAPLSHGRNEGTPRASEFGAAPVGRRPSSYQPQPQQLALQPQSQPGSSQATSPPSLLQSSPHLSTPKPARRGSMPGSGSSKAQPTQQNSQNKRKSIQSSAGSKNAAGQKTPAQNQQGAVQPPNAPQAEQKSKGTGHRQQNSVIQHSQTPGPPRRDSSASTFHPSFNPNRSLKFDAAEDASSSHSQNGRESMPNLLGAGYQTVTAGGPVLNQTERQRVGSAGPGAAFSKHEAQLRPDTLAVIAQAAGQKSGPQPQDTFLSDPTEESRDQAISSAESKPTLNDRVAPLGQRQPSNHELIEELHDVVEHAVASAVSEAPQLPLSLTGRLQNLQLSLSALEQSERESTHAQSSVQARSPSNTVESSRDPHNTGHNTRFEEIADASGLLAQQLELEKNLLAQQQSLFAATNVSIEDEVDAVNPDKAKGPSHHNDALDLSHSSASTEEKSLPSTSAKPLIPALDLSGIQEAIDIEGDAKEQTHPSVLIEPVEQPEAAISITVQHSTPKRTRQTDSPRLGVVSAARSARQPRTPKSRRHHARSTHVTPSGMYSAGRNLSKKLGGVANLASELNKVASDPASKLVTPRKSYAGADSNRTVFVSPGSVQELCSARKKDQHPPSCSSQSGRPNASIPAVRASRMALNETYQFIHLNNSTEAHPLLIPDRNAFRQQTPSQQQGSPVDPLPPASSRSLKSVAMHLRSLSAGGQASAITAQAPEVSSDALPTTMALQMDLADAAQHPYAVYEELAGARAPSRDPRGSAFERDTLEGEGGFYAQFAPPIQSVDSSEPDFAPRGSITDSERRSSARPNSRNPPSTSASVSKSFETTRPSQQLVEAPVAASGAGLARGAIRVDTQMTQRPASNHQPSRPVSRSKPEIRPRIGSASTRSTNSLNVPPKTPNSQRSSSMDMPYSPMNNQSFSSLPSAPSIPLPPPQPPVVDFDNLPADLPSGSPVLYAGSCETVGRRDKMEDRSVVLINYGPFASLAALARHYQQETGAPMPTWVGTESVANRGLPGPAPNVSVSASAVNIPTNWTSGAGGAASALMVLPVAQKVTPGHPPAIRVGTSVDSAIPTVHHLSGGNSQMNGLGPAVPNALAQALVNTPHFKGLLGEPIKTFQPPQVQRSNLGWSSFDDFGPSQLFLNEQDFESMNESEFKDACEPAPTNGVIGSRAGGFFAIYDGHGGDQTAEFLARRLHIEIGLQLAWSAANNPNALAPAQSRAPSAVSNAPQARATSSADTSRPPSHAHSRALSSLTLPSPLVDPALSVEAALTRAFLACDAAWQRTSTRKAAQTPNAGPSQRGMSRLSAFQSGMSLSSGATAQVILIEPGPGGQRTLHAANVGDAEAVLAYVTPEGEPAAEAVNQSTLPRGASSRTSGSGSGRTSGEGGIATEVATEAARTLRSRSGISFTASDTPEPPNALQAMQLSVPHKASDPSERARVAAAKGIIRDGRVGGVLAVSRAFGDFELKRSGVICVPYYIRVPLNHTHKFVILACDGLWDVVKPIEAVRQVWGMKNPSHMAAALVSLALNKHSRDNISVVVVRLHEY